MPNLVSMTEILARARSDAGAEFVTPGVISPADEDRWANETYGEFYDMLVEARGSEYFSKKAQRNTLVGVGTYPLATSIGLGGMGMADFMELLSVHVLYGGRAKRLRQWEHDELDWIEQAQLSSPGGVTPYAMKYRITDANFELAPPPNAIATIKIRYVPVRLTLVRENPVNGQTTDVDGVNGWEAWMVAGIAIRMRDKLQRNTANLRDRQAQIKERLDKLMANRNVADQPMIVSRGNEWSIDDDYFDDDMWPYG